MKKRQKQRLIKAILTVVCLCILALMWFVFKPAQEENIYEVPDGEAQFHFIDVGQGDATLIKAGNKNILIDTGDRDAKDSLLAYLNSHGVDKIDYFVVTHFDSDHFANATTVLETYDVKNVIIPDQVKTTKTYETFITKLEQQKLENKVNVYQANSMIGDTIDVNGLEMKVLAPLKNDYDDSNDYSVCLMVRYGNKKVLLTGDAEKEAEQDIVSRYGTDVLGCDVFKLGHHGSRTSSSQGLLNKATPSAVIVSCGIGNEYGHPHAETMERVSNLDCYRTDIQGTIVLTIANDSLQFKTEK